MGVWRGEAEGAKPAVMAVPAPDPAFAAGLAALAWQIELGANEAIGEHPIDRFETAARDTPAPITVPVPSEAAPPPAPGSEATTTAIAAGCVDLASLRAAMEVFDGCALKHGARQLVFADGNPAARVMILGEAPGRDEDREGLPFVGRSGQLLDRMLAAIGLARHAEDPAAAAYIANVLPWRPPANREPAADEVAMMMPFLFRHIELKAPDVLVAMGSAAARCLLDTPLGITRLRGQWAEWRGVPVLPMNHPAALLRNPELKRAAWSDLLALRRRLDGGENG